MNTKYLLACLNIMHSIYSNKINSAVDMDKFTFDPNFSTELCETPEEPFVIQEVTSTTELCETPEETFVIQVVTSTTELCETPEETFVIQEVITADCVQFTETIVLTTTTTFDTPNETFLSQALEGNKKGKGNKGNKKGKGNKGNKKGKGKGDNYCKSVGFGDFITDGTQQQFRTCSLTVQGEIPDVESMVSTIILSPKNGEEIQLNSSFTITIKSINIEYGFFDDPNTLYYLSPQTLNKNGIIQGHNHVVIQQLIDDNTVPTAINPLFFKGLNEASLDGILSTEVDGNDITEIGEYRLCTSTSSRGHQPVLSPVARRGFQDDCIRFLIV